MAPPDRADAGTIWLARFDDDPERGWYQADQVTYAQLAQFLRKMTIGDATKDSDDYISSWVMGNWTGGGQVEEINEGAETDRFWTAMADTSAANRNALPGYVTRQRPNSNCSDCYPLDVGNDDVMYHAFKESGTWKVWGFKESAQDYSYNSGTGVALGGEPKGKAIQFDGVIYVPLGSSGYARITGSAGTPSVTGVTGAADPTTASPTTAPLPLFFTILYQRLWCITTGGGIAYHTIAQKDAGANAWHWPYGENDTDFPHIESSNTPLNMRVFPDKNGVESIYVKTKKGLFIYDDNNPIFLETHVDFPPHPDINQSMAIWPSGGDLHAPVGLYDTKYSTAFVFDPKFGLARDHGLPNDMRGAIVDVESAYDRLYALVGGVLEVAISIGYQAKWGSVGSGDTNFNNPGQIARDSSGNIYIADTDNDRLKKHSSTGTYVTSITSLTGITGVAVDASGNIYVGVKNSPSDSRVHKYNSSLTLQWTAASLGSTNIVGLATDGVIVSVSNTAGPVLNIDCATGAWGVLWGSSGSGDGQFHTPKGIATDGTYVYVVDQGNDRIQKFTTAGAFISKWGTSGSGDGQFLTAVGIAINPANGNIYVTDSGRDDVQEFTNTGVFVRKFSGAGSGDGFVTDPTGIVVDAAGTGVYVADTGNDRVTKFLYSSTSSTLSSYPSLHYWTSVGWHGEWKGTDSTAIPRWMKAASTADAFRLWWGMSDGYAYHLKLKRTFHNARTGFLAGVDEFGATGYIETGYFDAAMEGFDKIASHLILLDALATSTETITVEFKTDGGGWEPLGVVNTNGRTSLPFELVSGFSKGRRFNKIAFRFSLARGSTITSTPMIDAATLHFTKIPQNTVSYTITLPLSDFKGRDAFEQYNDLTKLVTAGEFLALVHRRDSYDSDEDLVSARFRVLISSISGLQDTGESGKARVDLNCIAIEDGT